LTKFLLPQEIEEPSYISKIIKVVTEYKPPKEDFRILIRNSNKGSIEPPRKKKPVSLVKSTPNCEELDGPSFASETKTPEIKMTETRTAENRLKSKPRN